MQTGKVTYWEKSRGMENQWIQAWTYPRRGQAPQSEGTWRFGGGREEHMLGFLLSGDTDPSLCPAPPGLPATRAPAAFLHPSLCWGHLCAEATFEGDTQRENTWQTLDCCSRPEDIGGASPTGDLAGSVSSFPDVQTQRGFLLASEGRSSTKHRLV